MRFREQTVAFLYGPVSRVSRVIDDRAVRLRTRKVVELIDVVAHECGDPHRVELSVPEYINESTVR